MLFLKIIIWCIRICWHALMFKKHIIFQIMYIIVGPLCPASLKRFIFYKAQSALIGQLTQDIVIGRTPQAAWWASALKIKVKTVNNVLSFTISSCLRGEQSNMTDMMKLEYVCKQAVNKTISDRLYTQLWCDPVSLSLSHTHTHTHTWYVPGADK